MFAVHREGLIHSKKGKGKEKKRNQNQGLLNICLLGSSLHFGLRVAKLCLILLVLQGRIGRGRICELVDFVRFLRSF